MMLASRALPTSLLAVLAAGLLAGCGLCGDVVCEGCPPALTLQVSDAQTGGAVADATVSGDATTECLVSEGIDYAVCELAVQPGTYDFTVSAPGYDDQAINVTINPDSGDSCCSCGYNSKTKDVALEPST